MIGPYNPLELEPEMLKFWEEAKIYDEAKAKGVGKQKYYFLDGPPYTSGKVHIGTAWNKSLKDTVLRYKRMKGLEVWDRAGYDMHGLPTANKVMENLGIRSKDDIPKYGIAKFTDECKKLAVGNMHEMTKDFKRMGVWMDFDNAYQPISTTFIEGEWWLIKKAHENKRLYQGLRTMSWCASCATALAKHEQEYQEVTDTSIFVKFPVEGKKNEYLVIWTTTPWTLAFNLAVMVNPELEYVKADVDGEFWILAKALAGPVVQAVANKKLNIVEEFIGEKLEGLKYKHPWFDKIPAMQELKAEKLHTVLLSKEYVDTSAGTGLVHTAPGCGPEDYEVGHRNGLPPFNTIDEYGKFPENMGIFAGLTAKKDDHKFIEELKNEGILIETSPVEHDYAHCERCHNPVVFRATKQWFFKIEDLVPTMRELNNDIKWVPDWAGARQFDSWLSNLRDNSITKQRYWGTPIPIWKCDKCEEYDVIGSVKELQEKAGKVPEDLHKPHIDEITWKCRCGGTKIREPDILDVWVDAGTNSWTCLDYPNRKDLFEKLFPADFILEGKDQIRGWFNLLLICSMVTMEKPSYKSVYMHGFVQDSLGRKMSKSLGNYILPEEVINKYGADTFRYYSIGGAAPATDLNYNFEDMKLKYRNLGILWNLQKFMLEFAKETGFNPFTADAKEFNDEEKYMLSKLNSGIKKASAAYEDYRLNETPWIGEEIYLTLSRTYIQLIREKAVTGTDEEKKAIAYVIGNSLLETLKILCPVIPFITEKIYQNIRKQFNLKVKSIHLFDWPKPDESKINKELEKNFELVNNVIGAVLSGREKVQLGLRWPLKEIIIESTNTDLVPAIDSMMDILKQQTNVKEVKIVDSFDKATVKLKADFAKIGPEFGDLSPQIIAHLTTNSPETIMRHLNEKGKYSFKLNGQEIKITKDHLIIDKAIPENYHGVELKHGFVYLDTERTPELDAEGYVREVMRRVQALRKKAGLVKSDNILLHIKTQDAAMLEDFRHAIIEKVGAKELNIGNVAPLANASSEKIKGKVFEISLEKV